MHCKHSLTYSLVHSLVHTLSLSLSYLVMHAKVILLIALHFGFLVSAVSAITCSSVDGGGDCRAILPSESKCYNSEENYGEMRVSGRPAATQ